MKRRTLLAGIPALLAGACRVAFGSVSPPKAPAGLVDDAYMEKHFPRNRPSDFLYRPELIDEPWMGEWGVGFYVMIGEHLRPTDNGGERMRCESFGRWYCIAGCHVPDSDARRAAAERFRKSFGAINIAFYESCEQLPGWFIYKASFYHRSEDYTYYGV